MESKSREFPFSQYFRFSSVNESQMSSHSIEIPWIPSASNNYRFVNQVRIGTWSIAYAPYMLHFNLLYTIHGIFDTKELVDIMHKLLSKFLANLYACHPARIL